jgi:hypothetical protein
VPGNRSSPRKQGRTWREKLLTVPGIAAAAAFTTAVSWLATQLLGDLRTRIEVREPLSVTVKDNPARIGGFSDQPIYGVIPADVRTTGSPGPGCAGFRDWLKLNKGVDAGDTKLQLIVQGKVAKPILLSEMRVKVLHKLPLVTGIPVSCPPAAEANYRPIEIDLDANPPRVKYQFGKKTFGFTVQPGETEPFNIVAKTTRGHYIWVIELDIVVEGNQRTIEIGSPGGPFETTARQSTDNWEWDYEGGWSASLDTPRAGVPEKISAGTPLPPLK